MTVAELIQILETTDPDNEVTFVVRGQDFDPRSEKVVMHDDSQRFYFAIDAD